MNTEMVELRKICDLFEEAGFTVTYFFHHAVEKYFKIAVKSSVVKNITKDYEKETANAGDIVPLIEKNKYQILYFETGMSVVSKYAGTIFFTMIPAGTKVLEPGFYPPGRGPL